MWNSVVKRSEKEGPVSKLKLFTCWLVLSSVGVVLTFSFSSRDRKDGFFSLAPASGPRMPGCWISGSPKEPRGEKTMERKQESADYENGNDDQPDEWDKRIISTGCAEENLRLQLCHYDTNDWRQCTKEMEAFRRCWAEHNNNERTHTVDADTDETF